MMKKFIIIGFIIIFMTGCTATYDLKINEKGFYESLSIQSTTLEESEVFEVFPYTSFYDEQGNDENPSIKVPGVAYYDSAVDFVDDLKNVTYSYKFNEQNFKKSNIIATSFEGFYLRRYDHDENGKDDYMILSTSGSFTRFESNPTLEEVIINIECDYEIISSNADKVNKNVHTWYLTRSDLKSISMVYNPDKLVDNRTFWEKLKEGEYTNIFTVSVILALIASVIYLVIKRIGDVRDKI